MFISSAFDDDAITVTIDGHAKVAQKTYFDKDDEAVQLRRARYEESNFDWFNSKISAVVAKNILIYDDVDVGCLCWLIAKNIKIDLSSSYISPDALNLIQNQFALLKQHHYHAAEGSKIAVPMLQGCSGVGRADLFASCCREIGFQTFGGPYD